MNKRPTYRHVFTITFSIGRCYKMECYLHVWNEVQAPNLPCNSTLWSLLLARLWIYLNYNGMISCRTHFCLQGEHSWFSVCGIHTSPHSTCNLKTQVQICGHNLITQGSTQYNYEVVDFSSQFKTCFRIWISYLFRLKISILVDVHF